VDNWWAQVEVGKFDLTGLGWGGWWRWSRDGDAAGMVAGGGAAVLDYLQVDFFTLVCVSKIIIYL